MADTPTTTDFVTALADAARGDRTGLTRIADEAKERARATFLLATRPARRPSPSKPVRRVDLRLPDGRHVRAMIAPALARQRDLVRLQQRQDRLTKRLTELEARADTAVAGMLQGVSDLEQRARALVPAQLQQGRQLLRQAESVQQLTLQTQLRGLTNVVNTLQATAYGDKGTLLSTNNVLLAISQLFWTALDPLLQATGAVTPQTATIIAALAPIGTLVTGGVLVGTRQEPRSQPRERFVSGRTIVSVPGTSTESLEAKIDAAYWPTFRTLRNVPVTATIVEPSGITNAAVSANVNQGLLEIAVLPITTGGAFTTLSFVRTGVPLSQVAVAWTVDTGGGVV